MTPSPNPTKSLRFSALTIGLHWFMLLLLAAAYTAIELREVFPRGSDLRELMKSLHFMLGLSVLVLIWLRFLGRLVGPTPEIAPKPDLDAVRLEGHVADRAGQHHHHGHYRVCLSALKQQAVSHQLSALDVNLGEVDC